MRNDQLLFLIFIIISTQLGFKRGNKFTEVSLSIIGITCGIIAILTKP